MELQTFTFKITGYDSMLMHNVNALSIKKPAGLSHEDWEASDECFESKQYKEGDKLVIPSRIWSGFLIASAKAAYNRGIKPRKGKTFTALVKSLCFPKTSVIVGDLKRETQFVTIGTSKIQRIWPRIESWSCVLEVEVADTQMLNGEELKILLDLGGKLVGVGDYRPQFGRFQVEDDNA